MRESTIEKRVTDYAKEMGWQSFKFVSPNQKGVPDRIYIRDKVVMFIEFKALGKKPTKLQDLVISKITNEGVPVYIIDNVDDGIMLIDEIN